MDFCDIPVYHDNLAYRNPAAFGLVWSGDNKEHFIWRLSNQYRNAERYP